MVTKKILFICKFNRFRSRIAEAYLKKINPNAKVKSAGLIRGRPLDKLQIEIAKEFGLDINGKPKGLTSKMLIWQNVTIIVANDVPEEIFENEKYGKKTIVWKIPDTTIDSKEEVRKIIKSIVLNVDKLNEELK